MANKYVGGSGYTKIWKKLQDSIAWLTNKMDEKADDSVIVVDGTTTTGTKISIVTGETDTVELATESELNAEAEARAAADLSLNEAIANIQGGNVSDVQIAGTSIVSDGVANIKIAGNMHKYSDNTLGVNYAASGSINSRYSNGVLTASTLDYAVKAALTDSKRDTTYTDAEKANACDTIGAANKRAFNYLWELNEGISYDFETDSTKAYTKTVPTAAKVASILSIGGHSEIVNGEFVSADVDSVIITDAEGTNTSEIVIPDSIRYLDGHGWSTGDVYNEVDFENKKYIQRVEGWDLSTLEWTKGTEDNVFISEYISCNGNFVTVKYATAADSTSESELSDKSISWWSSVHKLVIKDTDYSEVEDFKNSLSGVTFYFESGEATETDISDILSGADICEPFECEAGGTITIHNNNLTATPNAVEYVISLAEVNG